MSRRTFYDRLLVSDDEFELSEIESTYNYLKTLKSREGVIGNDLNSDETGFMLYSSNLRYYPEDLEQDNPKPDVLFLKTVMGMGLIPVLEDHTIEMFINAHEMVDGGGMTFHDDGAFSCAASIYLNSVEGGEFQAKFEAEDGIDFIVQVAPKAGRAVIVKAETEHRVARVIAGTRRNIQIFIKYIKRDQK